MHFQIKLNKLSLIWSQVLFPSKKKQQGKTMVIFQQYFILKKKLEHNSKLLNIFVNSVYLSFVENYSKTMLSG